MRPMTVVVIPELQQLVFEIDGRPEKRAIQILPSNRPDQPLHEWMRQGNIRHRLDFGYLQDSQIGLPSAKSKERIVVRAEVLGQGPVASNSLIEHSAECDTVERSGLDSEPYDAAGGVHLSDPEPPRTP